MKKTLLSVALLVLTFSTHAQQVTKVTINQAEIIINIPYFEVETPERTKAFKVKLVSPAKLPEKLAFSVDWDYFQEVQLRSATPLIIDDDGSQDGMTALAYLLQNPKFRVKAITVSQGLAHPEIFGKNVMRMLDRLGITGIPVGVGRETPLEGNNAFPKIWRAGSDDFWSDFVTLPDEALKAVDEREAAAIIIDIVKQSSEPVTILATGPLTNIAEALRSDPSITDNIAAIHMMGGAIFVPGNLREAPNSHPAKTNTVAEWNIWVDPAAAKEVYTSGVTLFLTPLDATNQIAFTRADMEAWRATGSPTGIIASEFLDFALTVFSGNDPLRPVPVWDLVAAINLAEPDFCDEVLLPVDVITDTAPGETQGQIMVVPGLVEPNINVCINPRV